MPLFILYLLKLSISLAGVWLFYQLLLRRLTFYSWNRFYLLGYCMLAFFIPLINITPLIEGNSAAGPVVIRFIPAIGDYYVPVRVTAGATETHWAASYLWMVLSVLLLTGFLILILRLCIRYASVRRIRRRGRPLQENGLRIYAVDEDIMPFSFGNSIFINPQLHTEKEWDEIILHEYVHVRQRHTLDILFSELLCAFNWYNPFAWLIRHSIRQNLEFIADGKVLEKGLDKKDYQYHLLKVIGRPEYRLANNFNFSSLKKRIIMMNKIRSARLQLVKFMFILPLIAVLLLAFRDQYKGIFRRPGAIFINEAGIVVDMITHQPIAGASIVEIISGLTATSDAKGFYRLQVPVSKDSVRLDLVFHKDGYVDDQERRFFPSVKSSRGFVAFGMLRNPSVAAPPFFMKVPSFLNGEQSQNPGYEDALAQLQLTFRQIEDVEVFLTMEKKHPEAEMFYTTEDKEHHIVVLKNGQVEKYGYPGGPTVAEMEKKYGALPDMMTTKTHTAGKGYLSQWAKISAEAEKAFHTTNPDVLHIIFPGDSRVLAVPASGKPAYYDMDNADPKERPAFEKLYGKLPDCVPSPASLQPTGRSVTVSPRVAPAGADALPKNKQVMVNGPARPHVTISTHTRQSALQSMALNQMRDSLPKPRPLFIVDGVETDSSNLSRISPREIESIAVFKDTACIKKYGSKAKNGVVEINLKKKSVSTPVEMIYTDPLTMEEVSLRADTIRLSGSGADFR